MNRSLILLAAIAAMTICGTANAQVYGQRYRVPTRTVGHPLYQKSVIQHSVKGADCCAPVAAHGCSSCTPCCPPIIPCLLNKLDRLVHCLLPSCRLGCGGCGYGHGGVIVDDVIIDEKQRATPDSTQSYYRRRGTLQPRYQQATRNRVIPQPTPVRRTAAPQPAKRPTKKPRTRTASAPLKKIDSGRVNLQPATDSKVRVASFQQNAKRRIPNPLRK